MTRSMNIKNTILIACGAGALCALTSAGYGDGGITIQQVETDRQPFSLTPAGKNSYAPLNIGASISFLRFTFTATATRGRPAARLRYKLEGHDEAWRDIPNTMRGYLQFFDRDLKGLDTLSFFMKGETPGWRGSPETSDFVTRRMDVLVPKRAAFVHLVFISHGPESTIGMLGIDEVRISLANTTTNQPTVFDFNVVTELSASDDPHALSKNWERRGSRIALAELRRKPGPHPHAFLVFNDDDPLHYAIWAMPQKDTFPVTPGDTLTLEWQEAYSIGGSGPGVAEYLKLKPGNYFLRVAACRVNGEPTGEETVLPLTILHPFYHQWEFWLAMLIISSAGSTLIVRMFLHRRMRRRLAELERERTLDRERERIARDLHDNIGAGLTEIAMQTDWIENDLDQGPTDMTRQRIRSIRQSATDLARSVDEMVWAVNPTNDTIKRFASYLTQCAAQFLDAAGMAVRFDIPEKLPDVPLTGTLRHNLFLAVREALNNAAKHASATVVRLKIRVTDHTLLLTVEDDGQGFDVAQQAATGTRDGLENMRRRMKDIGGLFRLSSNVGQGTLIELRAPLSNTGAKGESPCKPSR